ncbi:helicase domain protein [Teredinibacter turnerae T7901]|uniref:Helicase domain protein n=1 Tax=Teredinibacter turnerae (strain ATCC 39867 / T7901) TaxID=377629 RepID=C5BUI6_TERTT|nr:helicase-related protein [Teredinibacter turnerae]ACR14046.1 helicase domain protein [Teredinibacter turnerae T7901]
MIEVANDLYSNDYSRTRDQLENHIRQDLFGPLPDDTPHRITEELSEAPLQTYKVGILFPQSQVGGLELDAESESNANDDDLSSIVSRKCSKSIDARIKDLGSANSTVEEFDIEELVDANMEDVSLSGLHRPSSISISFYIDELSDDSILKFVISGGRYQNEKVENIQVWRRTPIELKAQLNVSDLKNKKNVFDLPLNGELGNLNIKLKVYARNTLAGGKLLTATVVNDVVFHDGNTYVEYNRSSLFQTKLELNATDRDSLPSSIIAPYPSVDIFEKDIEEKSLDLLYRQHQTFGIGHGCAADWSGKNEAVSKINKLWSTALPTFETWATTAAIKRDDGSELSINMADLANAATFGAGIEDISEMIGLYKAWIDDRKVEARSLDVKYAEAAEYNLNHCNECLKRIIEGFDFICNDELAREAFILANKAILLQQIRGSDEPRKLEISEDTQRREFVGELYESAEDSLRRNYKGKGRWRPFQIAFILMSIMSAAKKSHPERECVDLIWFPTGGGKTEAYLGLLAFYVFYRRLSDPLDSGVSVFMRYTLRLLTADQFDRASSLICAMEFIRKNEGVELGEEEISIGVWLGESVTPNHNPAAKTLLKKLVKGEKNAKNPFAITKCPWCNAQIGQIKHKNESYVVGYSEFGNGIKIHCSDELCDFSSGLPVYVVDEEIYKRRPTLVIGTVDKFANVAWNANVRHLFGLNENGDRDCSPPGLIIQDELHLISGPLGSMVGIYETLFEELCTDYRASTPSKPKIVCSTATIRRFKEQIRALYGRKNCSLFPPQGLEAGDSFYGRWLDHSEQRGRKYMGIYGAGESIQTMQVRTMSIALQGIHFTSNDDTKDPYWTLLAFFNSLRELGTTITLFQSDIPTRINQLRRKQQLRFEDMRPLSSEVLELTSRLQSEKISEVRQKLKNVYKPGEKNWDVLDVCLASNIIEVGIDISRLSLMTIVGQPKTTAQYIQVSGRVGRTPEKPGLVLTIYSGAKPRDRSHFERFRPYHERLYQQVEPTSVTPFSVPTIERALHAILIGYIRQYSSQNLSSYPVPRSMVGEFKQILKSRIYSIYEDMSDAELNYSASCKYLDEFVGDWERNKTKAWEAKNEEVGLMYRASEMVPYIVRRVGRKTPTSMRNVDLECRGAMAYFNPMNEIE